MARNDIPPPPAGFTIEGDKPAKAKRKAKPRKREPAVPPPPEGFELIDPVATDGDTIRDGDTRVRLLGVDAPELAQGGWDATGARIPVGELSQEFLQSALANDPARVDGVDHMSYGRIVGPVTAGDVDAAMSMLESGNAVVAPQYIDDDERRADYVQADRLARMNRQGPMHSNLVENPAEFRVDPDYQPDAETIALFNDMPTPLTGLPPEKEAEWVAMLEQRIPLARMLAFAKANDFEADRGELEDWVEWRDGQLDEGKAVDAYARYERAPQPLIDSGDGAGGALVRGMGDGFLAGGLDEAGAVVDSLGLTEGRENIFDSDRRWADVWANNQQQNDSILAYDDEYHPIARTTGQVTGGLAVPFGAGARGAVQLAKVGGAYGAAEGFLGTDGDLTDRTLGAVKTAPVGAIVGAAGGKAIEAAAPVVARGYRRFRGLDGERAAPQLEATPAPPATEAVEPTPAATDVVPAPAALPETVARPIDDPTTRAQLMASASDLQPGDVLPIVSNAVDGVEDAAAIDAGRFAEASAPNEATALESRTVRNWRGEPVPKRGPVDMVGWLRMQGGLKDQGGELSHMGLTNAARRGDFVGLETRFGPLVNDTDGLELDDAALLAWEQGYFPELTERPDVNTFLDALRDTYNGGAGRRFLPEDQPELDAFYGMQDDRYRLEQQRFEEGAPIWADNSAPGDEARPFPPVEAYEDWGANPPDFAGNINLSKLDSPQDIARALDQTERRVGFDAATRGRVSQAETERLAAELNLTPEKLLARRKGQAFNAEEALAARQILAKSGNELVNAAKRIRGLDNPGDEALAEFRNKWMRHAAIQEQVAGMTAEAGRALNQFEQAADSRAIRGDVLGSLVRAGGGRDNLQDAARVLIEASEAGPGVFNAVAEKARKPKWRDKLSEFYINMLLSGPQTHAVNMASNTLTAIAQIPEYAAGAAIGKVRQAFSRDPIDRVTGSEVGARAFGLMQGAREGSFLFARALKSGEPSDFASKVEGEEFKAIKGVKGEVIRVPTRLLTAEDEFFKGIARRMELNGLAVRKARSEGLKGEARKERIAELVADPTDEMYERALKYGQYLTFQKKLGPIAQRVSAVTQESLVAKVFLPFVRTPTNLVKFAAERSPFAPMMKEWREQFMAGGEARDVAVAKMMLGTGMGMSIYQAALEGRVTGSAPPDPKKARLMYADGWKPQSIRLGDTWVSYARFDPFSTTLGVAADLATLPAGMSERQRDDQSTLLVASILGNLASKTWLSGISDLTAALADPDRYADNLLQRMASSFTTPAGLAQVARVADPVLRRRESIGEAIQARVPFLSEGLLPKRDIFGEAITSDGSVGPDLVSPVWQSKAKNDPVIAEMLDLGATISAPDKQYTVDGERVDYTPEEYDRYSEVSGRLVYNSLARLRNSPAWSRLSLDEKELAVKKVTRLSRETARGVLDDDSYQLPEKVDPATANGDVSRFLPVKAQKREKARAGAEKRDEAPPAPEGFEIIDSQPGDPLFDLTAAIPGVKITSGYRDEAYQEDMRRRGYKPAARSAHLEGDSIDMTPPAGKSMTWLAARVKKIRPDARILNERDHLHVTFPGWGGAPAIGNAARAGVINPADIPPPPPGFAMEGA